MCGIEQFEQRKRPQVLQLHIIGERFLTSQFKQNLKLKSFIVEFLFPVVGKKEYIFLMSISTISNI